MTTNNQCGWISHFIADCGRPVEALDLSRRAALVGGGLYGLRKDWIVAAKEEAARAAYREDTEFGGVFSGAAPELEGAIYEAIIA